MRAFQEKITTFAINLFKCDAIKFGDFKMKSGSNSPIYFDLRVIISYPDLMESVVDLLLELSKNDLKCDVLCGVPYTALPIATLMSVKAKIPMLIRRKEAKAYGTKKLIEGKYNENDDCIIIEDVITSGSSILETAQDLRNEKLCIKRAIVILDREQGGCDNLNNNGIQITSLLSMSKLMSILEKANLITSSTILKVEEYLKSANISLPESLSDDFTLKKLSFEERSKLSQNSAGKMLFQIMSEKQTNLCLAADVTTCQEVLALLRATGPYICVLKLHVDILNDFSVSFITELKLLADKERVLLMEDKKYADIGNTVKLQYTEGMYRVCEWAHLVTAHGIPGPGVFSGLRSSTSVRGIFVVAEMSSEGSLTSPQYAESIMKMVNEHSDVIAGVVCQSKGICTLPGLIQLTPGVQINASNDNLGQQYNTPESVVLDKNADVVVVGRGIIKAKDPKAEAKLYRDKLWESYNTRIVQ